MHDVKVTLGLTRVDVQEVRARPTPNRSSTTMLRDTHAPTHRGAASPKADASRPPSAAPTGAAPLPNRRNAVTTRPKRWSATCCCRAVTTATVMSVDAAPRRLSAATPRMREGKAASRAQLDAWATLDANTLP